jgi:two-component system, sensor histidine kinase ChiS
MIGFLVGLAIGAGLGLAWGWRALRKREELVGSLLAFAVHEVNTPVTAINMTVLNFINGVFGDVPPDQRRWIDMMRTQTSRLSGICGELRDMIHFELKRDLHMSPEASSLREAYDACLESLKDGLPPSELTLEGQVPADLPQVMADVDRLPRTIMSLIFHARKFRASGPVAVSARENGTGVIFQLEYLGTGITPEEAAKSLDLFYPARRRKDQMLSSVGLGLGTVRRLVGMWGGDLAYAVEPGGKSTIALTLPKAAGQ